MLQYGWRLLNSRGALWIFGLGCALLAALPGALAGTLLATPVVAFLLTGNPLLALSLLPGLNVGAGPAVAVWVGIGLAVLCGLCVWSRLYTAAVWGSDDSNDAGIAAAIAATRGRWRRVVRIYVESGLLLVCVVVPLASLAFASGALGPTAIFVLVVVLAARSLIRVTTTLAIRASVLDLARDRDAWRKAVGLLRERRADAAAVWIALLGIGAAMWLGGRLISPVLQDTAFDYPAISSYAAFREVAQIFLAVPLEAFLLVLSIGAWTGVYRGIEARPPEVGRRGSSPWATRAAASLLGLTVVANGIPTVIDARYSEKQTEKAEKIERSEIEPEEELRAAPTATPATTSYDVRAQLDGKRLTWITKVSYENVTGERLSTLAFNLYPAAYERPLAQIPLAGDILAGDLSGAFRAEAEPGTFEIARVLVGGADARRRQNETSMIVRLPHRVEDGSTVEVSIFLSADLPVFPERFGSWRGTTLLGNWVPTLAVRNGEGWRVDPYGPIGDPFFSDVADYHVAIEADDSQRITGSGSLTKIEQTSDQTRIWTFEGKRLRDVAYVASNSLRALEQSASGIVVRSWYPAGATAEGSANLTWAVSAVTDYTGRFGPLPFDEVDVVLTPGLFGGMEYPGVVFLDRSGSSLQGVPVLPELLQFAGFDNAQTRYVIGHEVAHQWWYASVGSDQIREPWLDEALAEVSVITWLRRVEGDDHTWRMTNLLSDTAADHDNMFAAVNAFHSVQDYTASIYRGGASALLELRERVGSEQFDQILRTYHEHNRLQLATANDFIEAIREVAGDAAAQSFAR
jgi:hypothetical protein